MDFFDMGPVSSDNHETNKLFALVLNRLLFGGKPVDQYEDAEIRRQLERIISTGRAEPHWEQRIANARWEAAHAEYGPRTLAPANAFQALYIKEFTRAAAERPVGRGGQ